METIFFVVLFWILCPIFAAVLAHDKNIGAVAGCFAGLLLGPIGILIIALIPKREKQKKPENPDNL